jgi:hypothetical protein
MVRTQKNKCTPCFSDVSSTFGVEQRLLHPVEKTSFSTVDPIAPKRVGIFFPVT